MRTVNSRFDQNVTIFYNMSIFTLTAFFTIFFFRFVGLFGGKLCYIYIEGNKNERGKRKRKREATPRIQTSKMANNKILWVFGQSLSDINLAHILISAQTVLLTIMKQGHHMGVFWA